MSWFLLLPLVAGIIYVFAALWLKRAGSCGAGTWLIALVCNCLAAMAFMILALLRRDGLEVGPWWQPALTGAAFVGGQTMTLAAIRYGDVSVATPVLGLKIILVAIFSALWLGEMGSLGLWAATVLATVGVGLVGKHDGTGARRIWFTAALAVGGAAGYAAFDVLLQKWAGAWGVQTFLGWAFAAVLVLSLPFAFFGKVGEQPRLVARYLGIGACLMTVQSLLVALTIGYFGEATAVNVIYSGRGLWSVVLVLLVGKHFANREAEVGRRIMIYRGAGALSMLIAMVLAAA